ncbi:tyrosine-type recombinase/integrase [Streptomyces sp. NPDC056362]|uniref:tyrosine-type recombinase/integrase n=1 Tax=unclassified Streptomyces TaxID=2593676 RepID=UPI0035DB156E
MSVDAFDEEFVDAELVEDEDGAVAVVEEPAPRLLVDQHTILHPGQELPTTADAPRYTDLDLRVSPETSALLKATDRAETGPMKAFRKWCAEQRDENAEEGDREKGRVPMPCTTATFTEYSRHLMSQGLKVSTIKNYMSQIRRAMPVGKKPDSSEYLQLLALYRKGNKRALRVRQAFPLTLPYVIPMIEKAEASGRPIGIRDAAIFAFGYRFLGRSIEDVDLLIEDLTIVDDRVVVWLAEDKNHKDEAQTLVLMDREDIQLVRRLRRWLEHLASFGVTDGPLFRHLLMNGKPASAETRAKKAHKRGEHLRPHVINERVKVWFAAAGLVGDGRPITSHGLRAGGATDLAEAEATDEELEEAGRWAKGSPIPRKVYVRPAKDGKRDLFAKVPVHRPSGT